VGQGRSFKIDPFSVKKNEISLGMVQFNPTPRFCRFFLVKDTPFRETPGANYGRERVFLLCDFSAIFDICRKWARSDDRFYFSFFRKIERVSGRRIEIICALMKKKSLFCTGIF